MALALLTCRSPSSWDKEVWGFLAMDSASMQGVSGGDTVPPVGAFASRLRSDRCPMFGRLPVARILCDHMGSDVEALSPSSFIAGRTYLSDEAPE